MPLELVVASVGAFARGDVGRPVDAPIIVLRVERLRVTRDAITTEGELNVHPGMCVLSFTRLISGQWRSSCMWRFQRAAYGEAAPQSGIPGSGFCRG